MPDLSANIQWVLALAVQTAAEPDTLDRLKKLLEITASVLTLIAVIVGAVWTYWLFIRTRQRYPSANLTQQIEYRLLTDEQLWVRVSVTVQNVSRVLLSLVEATCWIQQVKPVDDDILAALNEGKEPLDGEGLEYSWPLAVDKKEKTWPKTDRQIEPGESDQVEFDFTLSPEVETIIVYSYFRNAKKVTRKGELGWQVTSVYDLTRGQGDHQMEQLNLEQAPPKSIPPPPKPKKEKSAGQKQAPPKQPSPPKKK